MVDTSPYYLVELGITKHHRGKIRRLEHDDTPVKIRTHIHPGSGNWLPVWKHEAEHLEKKGSGMVTFTRRHIHESHRGGILPILAAIAPYILPVLGGLRAAAGVAGGIATAVNQAKQAHAVGSGVCGVGRTTVDHPSIMYGPTNPQGKANGQGVWQLYLTLQYYIPEVVEVMELV